MSKTLADMTAEECAAKWNHDTPTRIVRQRRSPVEVINE